MNLQVISLGILNGGSAAKLLLDDREALWLSRRRDGIQPHLGCHRNTFQRNSFQDALLFGAMLRLAVLPVHPKQPHIQANELHSHCTLRGQPAVLLRFVRGCWCCQTLDDGPPNKSRVRPNSLAKIFAIAPRVCQKVSIGSGVVVGTTRSSLGEMPRVRFVATGAHQPAQPSIKPAQQTQRRFGGQASRV